MFFSVFVPARDPAGTKIEKVGLYQHVTVRVQKLKMKNTSEKN
jgi:hypothetical protein